MEDVEPRRDERGEPKQPLVPHALDMPLQARAVPRVQVGGVVRARDAAPRVRVRVRARVRVRVRVRVRARISFEARAKVRSRA